MVSLTRRLIFTYLACASISLALAQQQNSAIDQARLFQKTPGAASLAVNANGTPLADTDSPSDDDSLGSQAILKTRQKISTIFLSGDASVFYTSNAALTRRDEISDVLGVTSAAASWTPRISPALEMQIALHTSIFRYGRTSALDFEDFGGGVGLAWNPQNFGGVGLIARYDFTELINRHGARLLTDHQFLVGGQKSFALGRAQAFTTGLVASAGISDPHSAQRDQIGAFVGYHCALSRSLDADLTYRVAFYRYNDDGRADVNQTVAGNLRYRFNQWAEVDAFLSVADNRSNRSVYDYTAFTCGGGLDLRFRF